MFHSLRAYLYYFLHLIVYFYFQYLKDVLELGEYEESFLRCETTGYKFMCLDESNIVPLQITHNTHKAKILGHSGKIRQIVFEKAVMGRPVDPITW